MKKKLNELLDNLTVDQTNRLLDEKFEMKISKRKLRNIKKSVNNKISGVKPKKTIKMKRYFEYATLFAAAVTLSIICIREYRIPINFPNNMSVNSTETTDSKIITSPENDVFTPRKGTNDNWDYMEYENHVILTDYHLTPTIHTLENVSDVAVNSNIISPMVYHTSNTPNTKQMLQTMSFKESDYKNMNNDADEDIIRVPEEINNKPVIDIAEECFISLRNQTISEGFFELTSSIIVPEDSPYFTVEHPSERESEVILYNKDKTTLFYSSVFSLDVYELPNTVTRIYEGALVNTTASITLEEGNDSFTIEDGLLITADRTRLITCADKYQASYIVPDTVTKLDMCAFYNLGNPEGMIIPVELPEGLSEIPDGTFSAGLAYPTAIPESVETIGAYSICIDSKLMNNNCEPISITIPQNVNNIGINAFYLSTINVTVDDSNQWYSIENNILYNKDKTELILGNDTSAFLNGYQIPDTVKVIRSKAIRFVLGFGRDLPEHIKLVIPESVTIMEENAIEIIEIDEWMFTVYVNAGSCAEQYFKNWNYDVNFLPIDEYYENTD